MMPKITEIIPDDLPEWAAEAFDNGQFFRVAIERVATLEQELREAADWVETHSSFGMATQYANDLRAIAGDKNE